MREPRWPHAHLLDRQTGEQASPGHELPVNEKLLPLTHESNVFQLKMTYGSPPDGWAFSGEPSEQSERPERKRGRRVRCNAMLGRVTGTRRFRDR